MKYFHATYVTRRSGAAFDVNPARRKGSRVTTCGEPVTDKDMEPKNFTKDWVPEEWKAAGWAHCPKCFALLNAKSASVVSENY